MVEAYGLKIFLFSVKKESVKFYGLRPGRGSFALKMAFSLFVEAAFRQIVISPSLPPIKKKRKSAKLSGLL